MNKAKIVSAAIKYLLKEDIGTTNFKYVKAHCHSECYNALSFMELYENKRVLEAEQEGFMLEDGTFVSRTEAMKIARDTNQVKPIYKDCVELKSYMIGE